VALGLVEPRGFEPLTPCMPLTSQPLAPQRASTRPLTSVLLSVHMAMRRHAAGCGDDRLCCWQIAGSSGQPTWRPSHADPPACPSSTSTRARFVWFTESAALSTVCTDDCQMEAMVAELHRRRRRGYEDYKYFPSRRPNRCTRCGASLPIGVSVLGKPLDATTWDIVCLDCGTVPATRRTPAPRSSPQFPATPRSRRQRPEHTPGAARGRLSSDTALRVQWPVLVNYLNRSGFLGG
jgi:hypothetical protein